MAIITDRFVYLHVPKTGGTHFGNLIDLIASLINLKYVKVAGGHSVEPVPVVELEGRSVLMGVRHPVSWLRSFWMHVQRSVALQPPVFAGMPHASELEELARSSPTFDHYIDKVVQVGCPVVSRVFDAYGTPYEAVGPVTLLHRETLVTSLLVHLEEEGTWEEIGERNQERVSDLVACANWGTAERVPRVDLRICDKMREADPEAFDRFYY